MRIGVIGIGGVGGYFGGKLAREYEKSDEHEIIFIARGEHLKAIKHNGLHLFTTEGNYIARPKIATDQPAEAGIFDLVFFCTKSYSLEASAKEFSPCINENTVVIPLLNGVNSAERLRAVLPQADVIGGSVYIISHIEKPGVIRQEGGSCKLTFGTDDSEKAKKYSHILDTLLKANIHAILSDKISKALWTKYLLMCPIGSLTSVTGKTYGGLMEDPILQKKARDMMMEVVAVANAHHVHLPEEAVDKAMKMIAGFDYHSKTSMQIDRERGRPTEIDALTAHLCKAGREARVPTPLHDEIYEKLK
ncbi:MAG TPA: 2-dehydropantoate 2-reductase [Smithella sp.]|nr:2-dehydropantoate 2-reductase [Smithella sp.]HOG90401.1 2-dehydropantoate 2-reductase [Smithella sp.]HOU50478.1 2-dehydropantoate 2-reductase [Smithella sp.]HQG65080.1 2-dehydropantoate 2-reductase [Smithella sp.]HQH15910.1 2-dehydropantoate 2-reductase [Smithella sp.]